MTEGRFLFRFSASHTRLRWVAVGWWTVQAVKTTISSYATRALGRALQTLTLLALITLQLAALLYWLALTALLLRLALQ